jgi:hypothetical protein
MLQRDDEEGVLRRPLGLGTVHSIEGSVEMSCVRVAFEKDSRLDGPPVLAGGPIAKSVFGSAGGSVRVHQSVSKE